MLKRIFTFQFFGIFITVLLSFLLLILPYELKWIRGGIFLVLVSIIAFIGLIHYQLVQGSLKILTDALKSLASGTKNNIDTKWIRVSPIFKYVQRISNRYNELEKAIDNLIQNRSYKVLSTANNENVFTNSLGKLESHLDKIAREEQQWKNKEEIRAWSNQGIAKFSDLLRQHSHSISLLSEKVLKELVKYIGANQGGIFLLETEEETDPFLKMVASYAYDRVKCPDKKMPLDDGLLAAIYHEKKSMYMTDLPEDYIKIRSGMGDAAPRTLYIVPLIHDNEVLGVIELSSFNSIEPHIRDFIEKVAESIASTLASAQLNESTSNLLEQSRKQAQELAAQEEELRQNMEEMKAQQEEMTLKQKEIIESENLMKRIVDLVPFPIFVKNYNREYILANQAQARLFNLTVNDILGKSDDALISNVEELNEIFKSDRLVLDDHEQIKLPEQSISLPSGERKIMQTIKVPFVNNMSNRPNILGVSIDYTTQRKVEQQLEESNKKIKKLSEQLEKTTN